jgi:hypothetical protein
MEQRDMPQPIHCPKHRTSTWTSDASCVWCLLEEIRVLCQTNTPDEETEALERIDQLCYEALGGPGLRAEWERKRGPVTVFKGK